MVATMPRDGSSPERTASGASRPVIGGVRKQRHESQGDLLGMVEHMKRLTFFSASPSARSASAGEKTRWGIPLQIKFPPRLAPFSSSTNGGNCPARARLAPFSSSKSLKSSARAVRRRWAAPPLDLDTHCSQAAQKAPDTSAATPFEGQLFSRDNFSELFSSKTSSSPESKFGMDHFETPAAPRGGSLHWAPRGASEPAPREASSSMWGGASLLERGGGAWVGTSAGVSDVGGDSDVRRSTADPPLTPRGGATDMWGVALGVRERGVASLLRERGGACAVAGAPQAELGRVAQ